MWLTHAEAIFHTDRITSNIARVNHVLSSLDEEGVRTVAGLLDSNVRYEVVRNRLTAMYAVPTATRFRSIVQPGGMGDRRPLQLLRDMRNILPTGVSGDVLKEFWLQKLPPAVLTVVSVLDGDLESLV